MFALVGHLQDAAAEQVSYRESAMEEMMDLHIENECLKVRLEAMEQHLQVMREMSEIKAENAALQAKLDTLEMLDQQRPRRVQFSPLAPPQAAMTPQGTFAILGMPHHPHPPTLPHVSAQNVSAALLPATGNDAVATPECTSTATCSGAAPAEIKRLTDLHKGLKSKSCPCQQAKASATKSDSK